MSRELSVGMADCFGKSDLPFLRCEGYFTELTALVQLQIDKDHSFDAYFAAESSASSLQDVTKLEFTQIHWTDDRLQRMSNLPDRVPALVELVLDGKMRKRRRRNFHSEEFLLSRSGLELILGSLLGHPALRILRVTSHSLSGKDIKRLAPSIQRLTQLHLLDLSGNGYGVDGVLAVAACLSELPDLVELAAEKTVFIS